MLDVVKHAMAMSLPAIYILIKAVIAAQGRDFIISAARLIVAQFLLENNIYCSEDFNFTQGISLIHKSKI